MQEDGYTFRDVTGLLRRRWKLTSGIVLGILLTSIVTAFTLENVYRGTSEIDIRCPEVPDPLLPGAACGELDRSQRIDRLNDEVMSRGNLATLVEKYNLYNHGQSDWSPEAYVSEMRPDIKLDLTLDQQDPRSRTPGEVMGFTVSFFYPDPRTARDVSRELADLFVNASANRSSDAIEVATEALRKQRNRLESLLKEQEILRSEFKARHPGAMPEDRTYTRQQLQNKQNELEETNRQLRDLQSQLQMIELQLQQTEPYLTSVIGSTAPGAGSLESCRALQTELYDLLGRYSPEHPEVRRVRRQLDQVCATTGRGLREALEVQLATRRAELSSLRKSLPEEHPDVKRLVRIVDELEIALRDTPATSQGQAPNNPVYVGLALRRQALSAETSALRSRRSSLQEDVSTLEQDLQLAPEVERELTELMRGYEQADNAFKGAEARLIAMQNRKASLEERLTESWEIHRYAILPFRPAFPNRPLIIFVSLLVGLTLGTIATLISEALDGRIRGTRDVRMLLDAPPIAAIPFVATAEDLARMRRQRILATLGTVALVSLTGVYAFARHNGMI